MSTWGQQVAVFIPYLNKHSIIYGLKIISLLEFATPGTPFLNNKENHKTKGIVDVATRYVIFGHYCQNFTPSSISALFLCTYTFLHSALFQGHTNMPVHTPSCTHAPPPLPPIPKSQCVIEWHGVKRKMRGKIIKPGSVSHTGWPSEVKARNDQ